MLKLGTSLRGESLRQVQHDTLSIAFTLIGKIKDKYVIPACLVVATLSEDPHRESFFRRIVRLGGPAEAGRTSRNDTTGLQKTCKV